MSTETSETTDTLTIIAEELGKVVQPLVSAAGTPGAMRDLLEELGWDVSTVPAALDALKQPAGVAFDMAENTGSQSTDIQPLIMAVKNAFEAVDKLKSAPGMAADMRDELPSQLLQYLLVEYLLENQPKVGQLLRSLGIIRLEEIAAAPPRLAYTRRTFAFSEFASLFSDPLVFFRNAFKWGDSDFRGGDWADALSKLLEAWGFDWELDYPGENALNKLTEGSKEPDTDNISALRILFFKSDTSPLDMSAGAGLFLLPETTTDKPGFAVMPFVNGEIEEKLEITEKLSLTIKSAADLTGGVGIIVRPGKDIKVFTALDSSAPGTMEGTLSLVFSLNGESDPFILFGKKDASRLEVGGVSAEAGLRFCGEKKLEMFTEFGIQKGKVAIKSGEGEDGFLAKVLPPEGLAAEFDLSLGFSTTKGLYFGASGGLEIELPLHLKLGPVEITSATIGMKPKSGKLPLETSASFKAELGPIKVVVEKMGLTTEFSFPQGGSGNLGPLNISLGFKPPNGLGLSIDAGVVAGGGYLYFDFDRHEYAGVLELTISGFISAKAIGLIATRMPDGSKGFSLLIIITAEFMPPFQLGYGFTLIGVGGLLGMNRTVMLEPLRNGVRTGAVNSIMFPQNVVANASRIISDLKTYFPVYAERFLVGPMGKVGYGTPTLISLSLGLIIEIPGNIAILGVLKVALPEERVALVLIQVAFLGTVDFEKKLLTFDASLYESRILTMTLEGDMAVRLKWGDNPGFLITVGGFHPSFTPPPLDLPVLRRLAISILNTSAAKIRIECYQAVTSNTVQFGARAELYFGFSALSVSGHIAFDALFQFSPFYFIIEISGSVSLKVFGAGLFSIRLQFSLEGPTPWRAKGSGSIKILFVKVKAKINKTWGESKNTSLPDIVVLQMLLKEMGGKEQWSAMLPAGKSHLVTLRTLEEAEGQLVLHPSGTLVMMQKMMPLGVKIDKLGNRKVSDLQKVIISTASAGEDGDTLDIRPVRENFARAQFQNLKDSEKLSKPSFEKLDAGVTISMGSETVKSGRMVRMKVEYEVTIIDRERIRLLDLVRELGLLFNRFFRGSSVSKSVLSRAHKIKLQPFDEKIEVLSEGYSVAFMSDNKVYSTADTFDSEAMASEFLREQVGADPSLGDQLHVIPNFELN